MYIRTSFQQRSYLKFDKHVMIEENGRHHLLISSKWNYSSYDRASYTSEQFGPI